MGFTKDGSGYKNQRSLTITALDILSREQETQRITTSSAHLDNLLGGGICPREITEICTDLHFASSIIALNVKKKFTSLEFILIVFVP